MHFSDSNDQYEKLKEHIENILKYGLINDKRKII